MILIKYRGLNSLDIDNNSLDQNETTTIVNVLLIRVYFRHNF